METAGLEPVTSCVWSGQDARTPCKHQGVQAFCTTGSLHTQLILRFCRIFVAQSRLGYFTNIGCLSVLCTDKYQTV